MGVARGAGATFRGAVLIASWRFGWTILVWLFIFVIIALLFKCLKSFLQTIGETIEQIFRGSDSEDSSSGARNNQSHQSRQQPDRWRRSDRSNTSSSRQSSAQRQRRWIQSRGVAASVAAAGDQNNPQIPNPVDQSSIPIGDADSIAGNNLPNTPDLPPQYDQLSIQGIYPQNCVPGPELGPGHYTGPAEEPESSEGGNRDPPPYSSLFPEIQADKK